MAPDSNTLTHLPPGPSGSTIAGILLLGLIARKSGAICSPLVMFTGMTLYGSPISSSATLILRPFGVFQVCSSMVIIVNPRESGYPVTRNVTAIQLPFPRVAPANAGTHNHRICCEFKCFNVSNQIAWTVCMGPGVRDDEVLMAR